MVYRKISIFSNILQAIKSNRCDMPILTTNFPFFSMQSPSRQFGCALVQIDSGKMPEPHMAALDLLFPCKTAFGPLTPQPI